MRRVLLVFGLLAACSRSEPQSRTTDLTPVAPAIDASTDVGTDACCAPVDAAISDAGAPTLPTLGRAGEFGVPRTTVDLLTAVVDDWRATRATLRHYRRDGRSWRLIGEPWVGVIGYAGTAWGDGLHGRGAPKGRTGPIKREGDGKSPAGVFTMRGLYGYAKSAPAGTKLAYTAALDDTWQCVDDPKSRAYNKIVDARKVKSDWGSAEPMRRGDSQYVWAIEIKHNPDRLPGVGSCHFIHVWTGEGEPTTGCTAMAEPVLRELIPTLERIPVLVLLPKAEYAALTAEWGLP